MQEHAGAGGTGALSQRVLELEAEVERLRRELSDRAEAMLSVAGFSRSALPPANFTIAGLEERVVLVDGAGLIRYLNSGMAQLLGSADKNEVLRTPLLQWEGRGALPRGLLPAFVQAARNYQSTLVTEQEIPVEAPAGADEAPAPPTVLRFVAHCTGDKVQVVVQDVTQLRRVEQSFARYVSPDVISQLLALPPGELMRVQRRRVSVMFTDLRGFTRLCEQLEPAAVSVLLDSHFEEMIAAVHAHGGTVDKLMGDGMMAVFGAPLPQADYSLRALSAGLSMLERHERWIERQTREGLPTAGLGIGMATGEVVVGNIGAPERLDYTAIGLVVSLAARLCSAAESGQFIVETQTYRSAKEQMKQGATIAVPRMEFAPSGALTLKNISAPVEIVSVRAGAKG